MRPRWPLCLLVSAACAPAPEPATDTDGVPCPNLEVSEEVLTWALGDDGLELRTVLSNVDCDSREALTGTASVIAEAFALADGEEVFVFSLLPGSDATVRVLFNGAREEVEGELWIDSNDLSRPRLRILMQALADGSADTGDSG